MRHEKSRTKSRARICYTILKNEECNFMERIESERLILRGFTGQDTDDLFRYAVDPDVGPRAG